MVKKLTCFLVLILVTMTIVSAATEIHVKTLPLRRVGVLILDPNQVYSLIDSHYTNSDAEGKAIVTYEGLVNSINIRVRVSEEVSGESRVVLDETFGPFDVGQRINLNVFAGNMSDSVGEEVVEENVTSNETIANISENVIDNETISNETNKSGFLSGFSISMNKEKIFKIGYYILGIAVLGAAIFFGFKYGRKFIKKDIAYDYKPLASKEISKELELTEKKLQEAQVEINKLKNKEKIEVIEKKIEQDKLELDKLKSGKI